MSVWRQPSVPDLEDEPDSFNGEEIPTPPAARAPVHLYDRDLHTLVGRLLAHAVKQDKRLRSLRVEVRATRLELRAVTRRQTATLGSIALVVQGALEAWRHFQ
jgi:hypothetical protein